MSLSVSCVHASSSANVVCVCSYYSRSQYHWCTVDAVGNAATYMNSATVKSSSLTHTVTPAMAHTVNDGSDAVGDNHDDT